jgi:signal transduction histidine kinase
MKIKYEKQNELAAIISLKVENITKWRMEHTRDAYVFSNDLPLNKQISSFLENYNQVEIKHDLLIWMQSLIKNYDYQSILLLDDTKTVRLSFPPLDSLNNSLISPTLKILDYNKINFTDLHTEDDLHSIIIDLVIPLYSSDSSQKNNNTNIGTVILRINPEITLFPLIQSWPTQSKSSETLLLRREGDSVLYLNELRHQKNTALKLKLPMSNKFLPAAIAASGYEGVFEGKDYRNVQVISFLKKIPESPWFMVAKVDKDELYSPLYELIIFVSIITFLVILSLRVLIGYYLKNQLIRIYKEHEIELKENELRLRELNATKDKFFTIIAHDLRSPFAGIICLTELLVQKMQTKDFSGTEEFATMIHNSSQSAMELITNLTVWARFQTGRMEFNPGEADIVTIINEEAKLLNASALQKSITIIKKTPQRLNIQVDKYMISTILRNLISNSIKFSNHGGEILVSAILNAKEVRIQVSDTGVGISKDQIIKLFRIETSFSTRGTQNEEGTGLGLILCKEFVLKHGGEIWAESEVNKGSKFTFTLPLNTTSNSS